MCTALNYIEHLLILASFVTGCFSVSVFAFLSDISIGINSSAVEWKNCRKKITAGIKKCKPIIMKKKRKHGKTVLWAKTEINSTKFLTSRTSIDSYISYYEFASVNDVLREYDDMKEVIKNLMASAVYQRF